MNDFVCLIDRRGSALEYAAGVLSVRVPDQPVARIGTSQIGLLVVHGRVQADTTVWRGLAQAGVAVALSGARSGEDLAWLGAGLSTSGALRHRQHLAYADPARRGALARWVLQQKLDALQAELQPSPELARPRLLRGLARSRSLAPLCRGADSLRGLEGALAADWFAAMAECIDPAWGFAGRRRRPPPDPVNALLSYAYAVAHAEALVAAQRVGLDPALGYLHSLYPGRHALALDALECLRPAIDALVLGLLKAGLTPANFSHDPAKGCRIDKAGRAALVQAWQRLREDRAAAALSAWAHGLRQQLSDHDPARPDPP